MLEFRIKAAQDVFNKIRLPVSSFFGGQFFSLGEFLMGLAKMYFERNPRFLDQREMIPGIYILLEFSCIVKNYVCLGDILRV